MDQKTSNEFPTENVEDQRFKLIDYFIKRLEHTINHTQTATKLIYLVNGAILAAVYFEFGKVKPLSVAFLVAGILTLLLSIINFLHANFMAVQNAWYSTIDREIRNVFLRFKNLTEIWPKHLCEQFDEVLKSYASYYRFFPFNRTHRIYVWIHLTLAIFLLISSISFFYMSYRTPKNINIVNNDKKIGQQGKISQPLIASADLRR